MPILRTNKIVNEIWDKNSGLLAHFHKLANYQPI